MLCLNYRLRALGSFLGLVERKRQNLSRLWKSPQLFLAMWIKIIGKARTTSLRHRPFWFRGCLESFCSNTRRIFLAEPRCRTFRLPIAWWQTFGCPRVGRIRVGSSAEVWPVVRCASSSGTLCSCPKIIRKLELELPQITFFRRKITFLGCACILTFVCCRNRWENNWTPI